ncbi:aldehyde reductase [Variovorax sp. ZS18.2.2]|uniref:SDR family oxidoreductase n=1 Tax=Variovorax sp. ZS18.2.2 TaxID=2971255 RepID=UPI0021513A3D|nr:aldehyde reductase [Variovorax sp. ZS18.2.2]MCR6478196.1 aldehyde reductase [Variovorax sp. ZS18.2.2]
MVETVLVTGGTGYVAGWCIALLLQRGYAVRTTVRSLSKEAGVRAAVEAVAGRESRVRLSFHVADLTQDAGWDEAVAGCAYVLHVASPLGIDAPKDPDAVIRPALDGTLRVLRAATRAGVRRVVMTSAAAAATPPITGPDSFSDESVWFDPTEKDADAYRKSKQLAERAAWDFMKSAPATTTLATILPGAVFGPVLSRDTLGSVQVIGRMLEGRMPGTPRLGFEVVDVRDLADAHIRAMTAPEAAGQRFLAVGEFMWMREIAQSLRDQLGSAAAKVPTRAMPDMLLRLLSLLDPSLRSMTPRLGRKHRHSNAKAKALLGWQPRPAAETLADCARSLLPGLPAGAA